jgi:hypothetical protein
MFTRPTWFTIGLLAALVAIGVVALAEGRAPKQSPLRDPEMVGAEIGDFYVKMVAQTSAAITDLSNPQAVQANVDKLRHKYIDLFVKLGREREALGPSDKGDCDAAASTRMQQAPQAQLDAILTYARTQESRDKALADELKSMLRLEEYANFGQLRAHQPREAARVGAL